jgi:hypothetical protein
VRHSPEAASHSLTVLSAEAVMSCCESGLHETEYTPRVWPVSSTSLSLHAAAPIDMSVPRPGSSLFVKFGGGGE